MTEPPDYTLRPAHDEDIEGLYALHVATMRDYVEATYGPWDDAVQRETYWNRWSDIHHTLGRTLDVVMVSGEVAGYLDVECEPDRVALNNIRVAAAYQNRGLGATLVRRVIEEAAPLPVTLRVLRVNPARRLYERLGFRVVEESPTHFAMRRESDSS